MRLKTSITTSIFFAIYVSGCVAPENLDENAVRQSVLSDCSTLPSMSAMGLSAVVPDKELIIRNVSVVDNACRTFWSNPACPNPALLGKWTFGQLMATMSGNSDVNSATARNFVNQWLQMWLAPQTVNPDRPQIVATRPLIGGVLLWRWLQASSCAAPAQNTTTASTWLSALQACTTLNLQAAPFRLLAISNRIDLDGRDYNGNGAPGELRFAFGAFNTSNPTALSINAEVILEYRFPNTFPPSWWASMFHNLSGTSFGESFASQLQNITDLVVGPNAQPLNPNNGSSIGQIRTDENSFDSTAAKQWEFRQFALPCKTGSCLLAQVPVSGTPPTSDNGTAALTTWLINNQADIATSRHVVPSSMLGGSSLSPQIPNSTIWNTTPDINTGHTLVNPADPNFSYNVRHNFAFTTCNGCHYLETNNSPALLFHIGPRAPGAESPLSDFLNRDKSLAPDPLRPGYPSDKLSVPDPNGDSFDNLNGIPLYFEYNEIWRRSCEVRRVFAGFSLPFTTPTGHN